MPIAFGWAGRGCSSSKKHVTELSCSSHPRGRGLGALWGSALDLLWQFMSLNTCFCQQVWFPKYSLNGKKMLEISLPFPI